MSLIHTPDDELKPFGKRERLTVCERCLNGIMSREDKQNYITLETDPDDEELSKCDWCEGSGFYELNEIL